MSSIPTKQIDGDVAVGRNVSAGGDANIQGNARVGHDMIVEGWLEAKNIKGVNKGLFATVTALREAYPRPHDGWFAGVSASDKDIADLGLTVQQGKALFRMYVGDGGDWVCEPINKLYEIVVDNEQVDNLRADLSTLRGQHENLEKRVDGHDTEINGIKTQQTTLGNSINTNTSNITALKSRVDGHDTAISKNTIAIKAITDSKGQPNGIAPLDSSGKVSARFIPGSMDDVVEFNAMVSGITVQRQSSIHKSTDAGCMVVYDQEHNVFVLAVSNLQVPDDSDWGPILRPQKQISQVAPVAETEVSQKYAVSDYWTTNNGTIGIIVSAFTYYGNWQDADSFGTGSAYGRIPEAGKIYTCTSDNKTFRWSGSELVVIGSDLALGHTANTAFPGDEGQAAKELAETNQRCIYELEPFVRGALLLNVNQIVDNDEPFADLASALSAVPEEMRHGGGTIVTFLLWSDDGDEMKSQWVAYQWQKVIYDETANWEDVEQWKPFGSGSPVGNCYNVTAARLANGDALPSTPPTYDTKQSAIEYAIGQSAVGIGVQITYAASAKGWRTFQYIGLSEDPESYANLDNWLDIAGQSAGEETILNVNELCKELTGSSEYSLLSAVAALRKLCESKGIDYFKDGLVITYCVNAAEHVWETKQLLDKASAENTEAWKDFGGGGNDLVANDVPTEGGTDAFSTGGAYERIIVDFEESFSEDGNSKTYQPVNAKRKPIGSPITVPLGGGSGSTDATSFAVRFESQTIYGAAGGKVTGRFAARSVTRMGEEEVVNNITEITVSDANTGVLLKTEILTNERSSATLQDWKFSVDFTDWFDGAGQRSFVVAVKDQEGNVRRVDVSVNCVDVTVEISKALHECRVPAGAGMTTLNSFYIFPRNTLGGNGGGIDAIIEILWDGEWRELGRANIQKTFSQDISINPNDVLGGGERMRHGSYLLRIHGYAPQAKVTGNYVYTSVMCVDSTKATEPIVAIRYDAKTYNEALNGTVALYDTANLQVAAYTAASVSGNTQVSVKANGETIQTFNAASSSSYSVKYQIQGYANGDNIEFKADGKWTEVNGKVHTGESHAISVTVDGSAIDVQLKGGAAFGYDFALRTNADVDKTITDKGVTMSVTGANWRTNGFVSYLGENTLRIAENMTARIPYRPFSLPTVESAGAAVQFAFATNNIKDKDALLMHSYDPATGTGFYVKGNAAGIYCAKGVKHQRQERKFRSREKITMAVVVEPASRAYERGNEKYSTIKMYLNGEEVACLGYIPGQNAISQNTPIEFNGKEGDLYLYYIMAYESHYEWVQAFNNYLAKLTDVSAMMSEFENEDVLDNIGRPSLDKLKAKGMPYYVVVAAQSVFDEFDNDTNMSASPKIGLHKSEQKGVILQSDEKREI